MNKDDILVSINCITYNHQNYIAEAIEGFLKQKTTFAYEIIIGEDCSTDQTRKIIELYQEKYPDKIRLITSGANVGMQQNAVRVLNASNGKYIAFCEGDDYWTDPYKLQKQADYMERHPECTLCFHNGVVLDVATNGQKSILPPSGAYQKYYHGSDWKYNAGEMVLLNSLPTASLFYPKRLLEHVPQWYHTAFAGDICVVFLCTQAGYAHYIDEVMSVYRLNVPNSVTTKWKETDEKDEQSRTERQKKLFELIDRFDCYSNGAYAKYFYHLKFLESFTSSMLEKKAKRFLCSPLYKQHKNSLLFREKIKLYIAAYCPVAYWAIRLLRRKLDG